jgi:hypothetical protein
LIIFILFNVFMAWWLFSYWGLVGSIKTDGSSAAEAGRAIGAGLASGFVLFMWALGAVITGLLALLTRGGKTTVVEDVGSYDGYQQHPRTIDSTPRLIDTSKWSAADKARYASENRRIEPR